MSAEEARAPADQANVVALWDDAHKYTPAPRHRRRLVVNMIQHLDFSECLDAGCAQPYLLQEIIGRYGVAGFGCDISDEVMAESRRRLPDGDFEVVDLARGGWPGGRQFDLVICSEVLEHIPEWRTALETLVGMTRKHLLITVPSGKIRGMDKLVGHHQHFQGPELVAALEACGCSVERVRRWGFPVHAAYKGLISLLNPERIYASFSGGGRYSFSQRLVSSLLYGVFFLNDLGRSGGQLFVLAHPAPARAQA